MRRLGKEKNRTVNSSTDKQRKEREGEGKVFRRGKEGGKKKTPFLVLTIPERKTIREEERPTGPPSPERKKEGCSSKPRETAAGRKREEAVFLTGAVK